MPTDPLMEGGMVLFAAALMITPGLMTDLFGLSLLIKPCRRWYKQRLVNWLKRRFQLTTYSASFSTDNSVVDAQVIGGSESEKDEDAATRPWEEA